MKVSGLIIFLQDQPQDMEVAFQCCSEQCVLEAKWISVENLCHPRDDGWVQNARKDMPTMPYLVFP